MPNTLVIRTGRAPRAVAAWGSLCVLLFALVQAHPARAVVPRVRDLVVVDSDADPQFQNDPRGAVFLFRYGSRALRLSSSAQGMNTPVAAAIAQDRSLLVVDANADPLQLGGAYGVLWKVDAENILAPAELVVASALFRHPIDLLLEPEGTVLLLDADADPAGHGRPAGAVFRVDLGTRSMELVCADARFQHPRSLTWDTDGSVLILDSAANPLSRPDAAGAIFRLNRRTGVITVVRALTRPRFVLPSALTVIPGGPNAGDYMVSDEDADPELRGTQPGAVFRVPRAGGDPVVFSTLADFVAPVDITAGFANDIVVLDRETTSGGGGTMTRGGLFRLDRDTGDLLERWDAVPFRKPVGLMQVSGADLDSSSVEWRDDGGGYLQPGDLYTMRATLRNTGTADAPVVTLSDTLETPWSYVPGSDSVATGSLVYSPEEGVVQWTGSLIRGQETQLRYRVRLDDEVNLGFRQTRQVTVRAGAAPSYFLHFITPRAELERGVRYYVDVVTEGGTQRGLLYRIDPDSLRPAIVEGTNGLVRPSDLVVLDDGRLAILDTGRPEGDLGAVLVYGASLSGLQVLRPLERSDGLVFPIGLTLGGDGALLLVDKDANPEGFPPPNHQPGAIYRIDSRTGEMSVVLSHESWVEPVDAAVGAGGTLAVIDYEGGPLRAGALWELPRGASEPIVHELNSSLFRDPIGLTFDTTGELIYIADPNSPAGTNPPHGAILRVNRVSGGFGIATANGLLSQPGDCALLEDGRILITDRDADPRNIGLPDLGAAFEWAPGSSEVVTVSAHHTLRAPDGPAYYGIADLSASALTLRSSHGQNPVPGDSLWLDLALVNSGTHTAPVAMAVFEFMPRVTAIRGTAESGEVQIADGSAVASWTGRVARGDTVRVTVAGVIDDDVSFGAVVGGEARLDGGEAGVRLERTATVRAAFAPSDVLLADRAADPNSTGNAAGAVFRVGDIGDPLETVVVTPSLRQPSALEWSPSGELILAAQRGTDPGTVYRFNTSNGALVVLGPSAADSALKTPTDLLYTPSGDLLVVDRDATGPVAGSRGAVFRKESGLGPLQRFASDSLFRAPAQVAYGPDGHLYLADPAADPDGRGGNTGAIFRLDPTSGAVLGWFQHEFFRDPSGVFTADDSTVVITDGAAPIGGETNHGGLFSWVPASGRLTPALGTPNFGAPWRTTQLPSGAWLIVDPAVEGPAGGQGVVFSFSPSDPRLRFHTTSPLFSAPSDIAQKPGPVTVFPVYVFEDLNGAPLHPADRLRITAVLRNVGASTARAVAWRDTLASSASLLQETATASLGDLVFLGGNVLAWQHDLAPGDSVRIEYEIQLNPSLAAGRMVVLRATADAPVVGRLQRQIRLQTHVPVEPGFAYLLDQEADPDANAFTRGAILKVDLVTGAITPLATSDLFRRPRDIAQIGISRTDLLVLDEQATTPVGRGALFRYDPALGSVELVGADATWRSPAQVVPLSERVVAVLDRAADPYNLTPQTGPGAVYTVDLETGLVEVLYSDTVFQEPTSMCVLPYTGKLAIADAKADPEGYGNENGAVFTLDIATRELSVFSVSPLFRTPIAICGRPAGGLYLVDRDATPFQNGDGYGSLHRISGAGVASLISVSPFFRNLTDVRADADGLPMVCDSETDPFGFGVPCGAILRWETGVNGNLVPLASSPAMGEPVRFAIYRDPTPVAFFETEAETAEDGIRLRWSVPPEEERVRFLVYRRGAAGPEDPGDGDPQDYELASGAREFAGPGPHEFVDAEVEPMRWYVYLIALVEPSGAVEYSRAIVAQAPGTILQLQLLPAAPNPFGPSTRLRFAIPTGGGEISVDIFDVAGRRIRRLARGTAVPGWQDAVWDGRDDAGRQAGAGLYFVRLRLGDEVRTGRLVRLR